MMWGRRGKRCECRDVDRGGERIVKLSQSGEREELEVEEKLGVEMWGNKARRTRRGSGPGQLRLRSTKNRKSLRAKGGNEHSGQYVQH